MERSRENAHSFFHARRHANTRSHLINARTLRKRQYLRSETVRTQPNLHVPSVLVVQVLWLPCHKTIYEISSSDKRAPQPRAAPAYMVLAPLRKDASSHLGDSSPKLLGASKNPYSRIAVYRKLIRSAGTREQNNAYPLDFA